MERYYYEVPERPDGKYPVFDRRRGGPHDYENPEARAVALCETRDDAELVTNALNAASVVNSGG